MHVHTLSFVLFFLSHHFSPISRHQFGLFFCRFLQIKYVLKADVVLLYCILMCFYFAGIEKKGVESTVQLFITQQIHTDTVSTHTATSDVNMYLSYRYYEMHRYNLDMFSFLA